MVEPSCPALVVLDDDAFRRSLIRTLDEHHFSVTYSADGDGSIDALKQKIFRVVLLGVDLRSSKGVQTAEYLSTNREHVRCGVIILGEPDPNIRTYAPWADETLLKPVDPAYVALRARAYCGC